MIPAGARTPPSAWYTHPAMHEVDRVGVLGRSWQYAGPAAEVAAPGSALNTEVAGHPVLVVNDPGHGLRAFYAVCRHRGGPVTLRCGQNAFLQCRYHGWTYRLDGGLLGTPQFERDADFDPDAHGLVPLRVATWNDLVFVCADGDAPGLDVFVSGIDELVSPMVIGGKRHHVRETYLVEANWKVYVDNYLEAYHVPLVHPEYAATLDYSGYREEVHGWWSVQRSGFAGERGYYADLGPDGELFYFMLWPNTMLNVAPGRLQVNHVRATAPDRCQIIFDYFYAGDPDPAVVAEDLRVSARIQEEDADICAQVQHGLSSPAYDRGRYSVAREQALYAYHALLAEAYAGCREAGVWPRDLPPAA